MKKRLFGVLPMGDDVFSYEISDGESVAEIMEYGASILSLRPFGQTDVVGGFDTLKDYLCDTSNQGAIVGRVANRIANAEFTLDGTKYFLPNNDNGNCLHGGIGFQHRKWTLVEHTENSITLSYFSPSGEDGFPSNLSVFVKYTLENHALLISYKAIPEGITPIALTNHAFFNLDGLGDDITNHTITIWADKYSETDDKLIPTGNHPLVNCTPLDLRCAKKIALYFGDQFKGYDHNMILSPKTFKTFGSKSLGLAARVENDRMIMLTYTDQPGLQFYTGNFLGEGPNFKGGVPQIIHGAFCLEAQTEPNCINHGKAIYCRGDVYTQLTVYEFIRKK